MPHMISVDSSSLSHVGYDPEAEELHVKFTHGGEYIKHGVSQEEFSQLLNAESIGKHFHAHFAAHKTTKK